MMVMMAMIRTMCNSNSNQEVFRMDERIPIPQKAVLTIHEAAAYTSIGINKIYSLLRAPNCPFVLYVGNKKLVKRKEFETFLSRKLTI